MTERALGTTDPDTLLFCSNLGVLLQGAGNLEAAEPLLRRALAGREATLGPGHVDTLTSPPLVD